jgi:hypothetical protein
MLGLPPEVLVEEIVSAVRRGQVAKVIELMDKVKEQAIEPQALASALSQKIRESMRSGHIDDSELTLLQNVVEVSSSLNPLASLEIALARASLVSQDDDQTHQARQPIKTANVKTELEVTTEKLVKDKEQLRESKPVKTTNPNGKFDMKDWPAVVLKVKDEAASLYTALRLAVPKLDGDTLTLCFKFPLHQKKITEQKAKRLIGELVEEISGVKLAIEAVVDKSIEPEPTPAVEAIQSQPDIDPQTQTISNIFGGAELLKS